MARLPDLVRDSQLDVEFRDGCTVHTYLEPNLFSLQREVRREETWKQERQIGGGGSGSVWLEICTSGTRRDIVRAVKKIAVRRNNTRHMVYVRELEAITKFSHPKVRPLLVRFFGLKPHS